MKSSRQPSHESAQPSGSHDNILSEYTFREKTTLAVPDETINLLFLELNRFDRDLDRCVSDLDRWCYALKHVGTLDALPGELRLEAFQRLFDACEIARFEPQVKLTYEKEMITERDYYNIIETAKDDGREQGREEGRAEGLQAGIEQGSLEAATRIARKLLASGMPQRQVCELTGLSDEQITALE